MSLATKAAARSRVVAQRAYSDFLMRSRLAEFRRLIRGGKQAGYRFMTHGAFWDLLGSDEVRPRERYLLIRHDIDTDPETARAMHDILHAEGIASSFFFRLTTFDVDLARYLERCGSEVGYHYEELATLAKRGGRGSSTDWTLLLRPAREAFIKNITSLRDATGLAFRTAASHGDFVNRRLGVKNSVVLDDPATRDSAGISLEAYDDRLLRQISSRHSDTLIPPHWAGEPPAKAIARGEQVIYLLVHPGNWQARALLNAREDAVRTIEGAQFHLKRPSRRALIWDQQKS